MNFPRVVAEKYEEPVLNCPVAEIVIVTATAIPINILFIKFRVLIKQANLVQNINIE